MQIHDVCDKYRNTVYRLLIKWMKVKSLETEGIDPNIISFFGGFLKNVIKYIIEIIAHTLKRMEDFSMLTTYVLIRAWQFFLLFSFPVSTLITLSTVLAVITSKINIGIATSEVLKEIRDAINDKKIIKEMIITHKIIDYQYFVSLSILKPKKAITIYNSKKFGWTGGMENYNW